MKRPLITNKKYRLGKVELNGVEIKGVDNITIDFGCAALSKESKPSAAYIPSLNRKHSPVVIDGTANGIDLAKAFPGSEAKIWTRRKYKLWQLPFVWILMKLGILKPLSITLTGKLKSVERISEREFVCPISINTIRIPHGKNLSEEEINKANEDLARAASAGKIKKEEAEDLARAASAGKDNG